MYFFFVIDNLTCWQYGMNYTLRNLVYVADVIFNFTALIILSIKSEFRRGDSAATTIVCVRFEELGVIIRE